MKIAASALTLAAAGSASGTLVIFFLGSDFGLKGSDFQMIPKKRYSLGIYVRK